MTPFAHTGSNSEKLLKREICRRQSSTHSTSCCIMIYAEFSPLLTGANCAYILSTSAVKLYFENFNDVISAYCKYSRKRCWSLIDAKFSPLFTGANCALILLIVAEKSYLEIFMTSYAHTGSTFEKVVQMKCVEFDSVLPDTNCSSISLIVPGLFTFKGIYDVIFVNLESQKKNR